MTLVVRDEQDIVATTLDYHLNQGVDLVMVTDHNSQDATPEILREYARSGRVKVFRDEGGIHDQRARVNRMIEIACEQHGADWLLHCDADEFWWPESGSLKDVFSSVPDGFDYVEVQRYNFIPSAAANDVPFHARMCVREVASKNLRGGPLEPKVAHRGRAGVTVGHGNHQVESTELRKAPDIGALSIFHYPIRSYEQFERKVVNLGTGYEALPSREPEVGCDQLELLRRHREGGLRAYFDAQLLGEREIQSAVAGGALREDRRLASFLDTATGAQSGGPVAGAETLRWLADAWRLAGELADVQSDLQRAGDELTHTRAELTRIQLLAGESQRQVTELQARISVLDTQLADTHSTVARLDRELAVLRESRLFRHTSAARRWYYRARDLLR